MKRTQFVVAMFQKYFQKLKHVNSKVMSNFIFFDYLLLCELTFEY